MQEERRTGARLAVFLVEARVQRIGVDILCPVLPELFALQLGRLARTLEAIAAVRPVLALRIRLNVRVVAREALLRGISSEGRVGLPESDGGRAVTGFPLCGHAAVAVDARGLNFRLPLSRIVLHEDRDARLVPARLIAHLGLTVSILAALDGKALHDNEGFCVLRQRKARYVIAEERSVDALLSVCRDGFRRRGRGTCRTRRSRRTLLRFGGRKRCLSGLAAAGVLRFKRSHRALPTYFGGTLLLDRSRAVLRLCLRLYLILIGFRLARRINLIDRLFDSAAIARAVRLALFDFRNIHNLAQGRIACMRSQQDAAKEQRCRNHSLHLLYSHDGFSFRLVTSQ